ncbi:unnamed protein product [Mytilus coruscus]|uniref:Uncharacterized protein n=1 Tax=Mytilus coruscus TaxID=42192 RepID=A0A6J8E6P1_MYTCO|nr:unnamed protein product [Mytilus coruscus]
MFRKPVPFTCPQIDKPINVASSSSVQEHSGNVGYTKPNSYDGKSNWSDYKVHFEIVVQLNGWSSEIKPLKLISCMQNEAHAAIGDINTNCLPSYNELINTLRRSFREALKDYDLAWALTQLNIDAIDDALNLALKYEAFHSSHRKPNLRNLAEISTKNPFQRAHSEKGACYYCGEPGHFKRDCEKRMTDNKQFIQQMKSGQYNNNQGKLLVAGREGHLQAEPCITKRSIILEKKTHDHDGLFMKAEIFSRIIHCLFDTGSSMSVLDDEIQRMVEGGIIRHSQLPWMSPIVVVRKRDQSIRLCIDLRLVNDLSIKDKFPLPRIEDCLDALRGNQWFSTLDLASGYHQVAKTKTRLKQLLLPEFIVDTDASGTGVGVVLSQINDDGKECVIAYYSRTLSKTELQYCVTRREFLAIVLAVKHFHHYLYGSISQYAEAYGVPDIEARTVADKLLEEFICRYGLPLQIHTDQGSQFTSDLFIQLCKKLHIDKTRYSPFHPQSSGLVERLNRTIEDMISKFVAKHQKDLGPILTVSYDGL